MVDHSSRARGIRRLLLLAMMLGRASACAAAAVGGGGQRLIRARAHTAATAVALRASRPAAVNTLATTAASGRCASAAAAAAKGASNAVAASARGGVHLHRRHRALHSAAMSAASHGGAAGAPQPQPSDANNDTQVRLAGDLPPLLHEWEEQIRVAEGGGPSLPSSSSASSDDDAAAAAQPTDWQLVNALMYGNNPMAGAATTPPSTAPSAGPAPSPAASATAAAPPPRATHRWRTRGASSRPGRSAASAKTARLLIDAFGVRTLPVLRGEGSAEEEASLQALPRLGPKTLAKVRSGLTQWEGLHASLSFCSSLGVLAEPQIAKLLSKYGAGVEAVVRPNPYHLLELFPGLRFTTVDALARGPLLALAPDAPVRAAAVVQYCMRRALANGHCAVPQARLAASAARQLVVPGELDEAGGARDLTSTPTK